MKALQKKGENVVMQQFSVTYRTFEAKSIIKITAAIIF